MKTKLFFFMLMFFAFASSLCFADKITLKSGEVIEAKIIKRMPDMIRIEYKGEITGYRMESVEKINDEVINPPGEPSKAAAYMYKPTEAKDIFARVSQSVVFISVNGGKSLGSGFIISPDGVIVTAVHVLANSTDVKVRLKDGMELPVKWVLYQDNRKDLAVIKIDAQNLPALPLGNKNSMSIGDKVYCIGNPLGLDYSLSDGLVSGFRNLEGVSYVQFTAPISPGNSGGPVVNASGEVIGIAEMVLTGQEKIAQNLNLAAAVNELPPDVASLPPTEYEQSKGIYLSKADQLVQEGSQQYAQGNKEKAEKMIEEALQEDPDSASANNMMGRFYYEEKNFEKAQHSFEKAIAQEPNFAKAYSNLGVLYYRLGRSEQAEGLYKKAIALDPNNIGANNGLALIYRKRGQIDQAEELLKKTIALEPKEPISYINLEGVYYIRGQLDLAEDLGKKAIALDPNQADAYGILGQVYRDRQEWDKAIDNYNKAIELDPQAMAALGITQEYVDQLKEKVAGKKNSIWPFGK
ncbi:MAG: tetratricopeptide repeat protein [Candidatus Omnitrophica bacterium]|nr:tetratricopeptide repeat protein [Candidatus Omnitrophota bacterium]